MFKGVYVKHTIRSNDALNWSHQEIVLILRVQWKLLRKIHDKTFPAQLPAFETLLFIKVDGKLRMEKESAFSSSHHKAA